MQIYLNTVFGADFVDYIFPKKDYLNFSETFFILKCWYSISK